MKSKEIALYEIPEVLEKAEFLDDSLIGAYNDSFAGWNERARNTLGKMNGVNGEAVNSSPLMFIRMHNAGILPKNTRLATRPDLERAIDFYARANNGANFTAGVYTDFGLALRTAGDSYAQNDALARKLAGQLDARGIELGNGVLIPVSALKDSEDSCEAYGVTLDLNELATKDTIRPLEDFKWDWTRKKGLACAGRDVSLWGSDDGDLDRSNVNGRVVVVRAEGTPAKILEQKLDNCASARQNYINGLKKLREQIDADLS